MPYLSEMDGETGYVSNDTRNKGLEFTDTYQSGSPFPHIVIDDFLPPEILDLCLSEFPSLPSCRRGMNILIANRSGTKRNSTPTL